MCEGGFSVPTIGLSKGTSILKFGVFWKPLLVGRKTQGLIGEIKKTFERGRGSIIKQYNY